MICILNTDPQPFHEFVYIGAAVKRGPEERRLPFLRAYVKGLPFGLDAIFAASDIQGLEKLRVRKEGQSEKLLGEALADEVLSMSAAGSLPPAHRIGVLLGGDLACRPGANRRRRGGYRDVLPVWQAFSRFRWLAGIAGNHDILGRSPLDLKRFLKGKPVHFLDAASCVLDGLRVAGLGGVIGNSRKSHRRNSKDFIAALRSLLEEMPDILVIHESHEMAGLPDTGNHAIGEVLAGARDLLVISGHKHWEMPPVAYSRRFQLLNTDNRAILLIRWE
jgi:Icc protein